MAKPLIQMALDSLDFDQTVGLATQVAPYVDIFEIGTPCIKHNGVSLVRELKSRFPDKLVLVDLKTMDAGEYEATPFYAAGADICTVLGVSGIATIAGVIKAANAHGAEAQVDLINVPDKLEYPYSRLDHALVSELSQMIRKYFQLNLFGYDVVQRTGTQEYYIVDINYFPGFKNFKDLV